MTLQDWLNRWSLKGLKLRTGFLELEWSPQNADQDAAWELYIELLTRITTQPLSSEHGDEKAALDSVFSLFGLTRDILKRRGRSCGEFAKIAIVVLNQVVRPFTARWHKKSLAGALADSIESAVFRRELSELQSQLREYSRMLADIAGVEDLTDLEAVD